MTAHQQRLGLLFILVGPTGAGKNTLINGVLGRIDALQQLPTATTRPIRPGEKEGREHHFISRDEFERMIGAAELLEWQNVHGNLYGVPKGTVEYLVENRLDRIADIDVLGGMLVRSLYPDNVILIFVRPGTDEEVSDIVRERLEGRGDNAEEIETRLRRVEMEMEYAPQCDYLITNDNADRAASTLESIIRAEYSRRDLVNLRVARNLPRHVLVYSSVAVAIRDDQVLCYKGKLPMVRMLDGEMPGEAALRAFDSLLSSEAVTTIPRLITMTFENQPRCEQGLYWYELTANIQSDLPNNWTWEPLMTAIPDAVYQQLTPITDPSRPTVGK